MTRVERGEGSWMKRVQRKKVLLMMVSCPVFHHVFHIFHIHVHCTLKALGHYITSDWPTINSRRMQFDRIRLCVN